MRAIRAAALVALGGALYHWLVRQRLLNWGARPDEVAGRLPGDELLEDADGVSTRAIEIGAPAVDVWPWLAQMGPSPRGGAYTYDWIENLLRLDMHSVDRVLPEFQHPRSATRSASARTGCASSGSSPSTCSPGAPQTAIGSGRSCSKSANGRHAADQPQPVPPSDARRTHRHVADGARLAVMERKMLHGIKQRAERLAETRLTP